MVEPVAFMVGRVACVMVGFSSGPFVFRLRCSTRGWVSDGIGPLGLTWSFMVSFPGMVTDSVMWFPCQRLSAWMASRSRADCRFAAVMALRVASMPSMTSRVWAMTTFTHAARQSS